jgi:SAM-dependent methyltransferase
MVVKRTMSDTDCWVCGERTRRFWTHTAFDAIDCEGCGHIQAKHRLSPASREADYHRTYDQGEFVASLAVTRRRQAQVLLDALVACDEPLRSIFDFGCGRGWLLEAARDRGVPQLAGGDVSKLALELLEKQGIVGIELDEVAPFDHLSFDALGFAPQVVTFLDVIEHFQGNLKDVVAPWLARLPAAVRTFVFKVPTREGLLFSMANLARRVGVPSLGAQLFQVGTYPPHYQYFTHRSLSLFVSNLGLEPVRVVDDIDFEPAALGGRLTGVPSPFKGLAGLAGRALGSAATLFGRADSRMVIARR